MGLLYSAYRRSAPAFAAASMAILSGCVTVFPPKAAPVAAPASARALKLYIQPVKNHINDSFNDTFREALEAALLNAGFHMAADSASADGLLQLTVNTKDDRSQFYTTLRLTAEGQQIESVDFFGGGIGNRMSGREFYVVISEIIASHLVARLAASPKLEEFAARPRKSRTAPSVVTAIATPAAPPDASAFASDIEVPSFKLAEDETKFALVVGVENYQSAMKAEYAARDARAVKAYLTAAGYPERNIIFLVDQQAGKSALEKYLEAWLPRNTDHRSTVLFYFSGHGAPDPEKGQAYLMPWDADAKFTETTGYPVKRLYAKLNALKARRVLVAMDACFSGTGPRSVIGKGLRPLVPKIDDGGGYVGRVGALTASASDEMTGSNDASGHGLFTYHLLKAMNARGGKATLKELFDYLSPKVRDAARRDNRDQSPQLVGEGLSTL